MKSEREFVFRITPFTPATMPMARLAEYMGDLAQLLGNEQSVHFLRVAEGSACLEYQVEDEAIFKVNERVAEARSGKGPAEASNAVLRINRRLTEDGGRGAIAEKAGAEIIQFPGKIIEEEAFSGQVIQHDFLDGYLVRLGGKREDVPIHFEDRNGRPYSGTASRSLARALGPHLFGGELRLFGSMVWAINSIGKWDLEKFHISRFEILEEDTLLDAVTRLRSIKGGDWESLKDPWAALSDLVGNEVEALQ